jgi:hypothetical protein
MKKLLVVLLISFFSMGFTIYVDPDDDFGARFSKNWLSIRDALLTKGVEIDEVLGTQRSYAKPGTEYVTVAYFEEGVKYLFIGYSDFAEIQLCYAENLDRGDVWRKKKWQCSIPSKGHNSNPVLGIEVKKTGQYLIKVKTIGSKAGIHQGNLVYLYKPGSNDKTPQLRQDQYYQLYGN